VIHNPSIILLDEPETGLDPHATLMMRSILDEINSGDRTIVMTTHNLERGMEMGDRIVILNKGKIAYDASKKDIDTAGFSDIYNNCTGMRA